MDCNSYSYAPTMLDGESVMAHHENDDMYIELYKWGNLFVVSAWSYDGSMDVYETFRDQRAASLLYDYIVEHYSDTPPGDELNDCISALHQKYGSVA